MFQFNCRSLGEEARKSKLWRELSVNEIYDIEISNFESIESFFVTAKYKNVRQWNDLTRRLGKKKLTPLDCILPGDFCLVESRGRIIRAMVQLYGPFNSMCYSVDTAEIIYAHYPNAPIYKMSSKIRKTMPFQAIRCKLAGIKPINQNRSYTDIIFNTVIKSIKKPQIRVVQIYYTSDDNDNPLDAADLHEVVLYDGINKQNVNDLLVKYQLVEAC